MDKIEKMKKYRLIKWYVAVLLISTAVFIYMAPKVVQNQDQTELYPAIGTPLDLLTEKELETFEVEHRKVELDGASLEVFMRGSKNGEELLKTSLQIEENSDLKNEAEIKLYEAPAFIKLNGQIRYLNQLDQMEIYDNEIYLSQPDGFLYENDYVAIKRDPIISRYDKDLDSGTAMGFNDRLLIIQVPEAVDVKYDPAFFEVF